MTTIPFTDTKNEDLLRLSGKELRAAAEGKTARAKAAKAELDRRKANRAAKSAAAA